MRILRKTTTILLFMVMLLAYSFLFMLLIGIFKQKKMQPEMSKKEIEKAPPVIPGLAEKSPPIAKLNGYDITGQEVSYNGVPIEGADRESFVIFFGDLEGHKNGAAVLSDYAEDKNHIYFQGRTVSNVDVKSFRVTPKKSDSRYTFEAEDDFSVFLHDKAINLSKKELFSSFYAFPSVRFLDNGGYYWRVFNGQLYYYLVDEYSGSFQELLPVRGIDISKAKLLGDQYPHYVTDGSRVFYQNQELKGVDAETFQVMNGWAKDKNSVYMNARKLEKADPDSFEMFKSGPYFRDRYHVYMDGTILSGADADSFEVVEHSYGKDKKRVYYRDTSIEGADPASFSPFVSYFDGYSKDKNEVFFLGKRVPFADVASFSFLGGCGGGYASDLVVGKDAKSVYGNGKLLKGMQPESVQIGNEEYTRLSNREYLRDADSIMKCSKDASGEKIQIDPETFRQDGEYFIGKEGVYFDFQKVVGANPEHFFILRNANRTDDGFVGISGSDVYVRGKRIRDVHAEETQMDWCGVSTRYLCMYGFTYDTMMGKSVKNMGNNPQFVQATSEQQDIMFQNQLAKEEGKPFPDVKDLGNGYSKNAGKLYFEGNIVKGVDAETFSTDSAPYDWATDKNFVYWKGEVVGK